MELSLPGALGMVGAETAPQRRGLVTRLLPDLRRIAPSLL